MLKPIETLLTHGQSLGLSAAEIQRQQNLLQSALLSPMESEPGQSVMAVFAHGPEATRMVCAQEDDARAAHWAVQLWSVARGGWLTQRTYDRTPAGRVQAYIDAHSWHPAPTVAEVNAKWSSEANFSDGLVAVFRSREAMAEFWYAAMAAEFSEPTEAIAWPLAFDVAECLFLHAGHPHPKWGESDQERVLIEMANLADSWGEVPAPILSGTLRDQAGQVVAVVQYRSVQEAVGRLLAGGRDAVLHTGALDADASGLLFEYRVGELGQAQLTDAQLADKLQTYLATNSKPNLAPSASPTMGVSAAHDSTEQTMATHFGYYIDLDERGDFLADVRDKQGNSVFEIRAGASLGEDESSIFEEGFMRDKRDVAGLTDYLRSLGVLGQHDHVLSLVDFERHLKDEGNDASDADEVGVEPSVPDAPTT